MNNWQYPGQGPGQPGQGYPPNPNGYGQPGQGFPPPGGTPASYESAPPPPQGYYYPNQYAPPAPAYGYGYGQPSAVQYWPKADFGQRFISYLVDGFILSAMMFILFFLAFIPLAASANSFTDGPSGAGVALFLLVLLAAFVLPVVYLVLLIGKGQTLGNKVAGMRIVDAQGQPPGAGKASLRLLIQLFLSGFFYIGYLWMLWDPEQQTLHDKLAGTYGISSRR